MEDTKTTFEKLFNETISSVLEIYDRFPIRSDFYHPKSVPFDVEWARFRLEGDMRLIGFVIPNQIALEKGLPNNVFYIVFLDKDHRFYLTKKN